MRSVERPLKYTIVYNSYSFYKTKCYGFARYLKIIIINGQNKKY